MVSQEPDGDWPGRWVRVLADYSGEGVWDRNGYSRVVDAIPISDGLRADILAWAEWYDRDCEDGMPDPRPFPYAQFAAHGLALAKRVKAELPGWTVIYHDPEKARELSLLRIDADRSYFEYEITDPKAP